MLQNYFSQDSNRKLGRDPTTPQGSLKQISDDFSFQTPRPDRSSHVVNKIACKNSDFNVVCTLPDFCRAPPPAPSTVQAHTLLPPVLCQSGRYKTVAKDVRLNRMPAFIFKASKTNRITGDEPALPGRMGVFSHTATKLAWPRAFFFS